jgi:hypothetical protein
VFIFFNLKFSGEEIHLHQPPRNSILGGMANGLKIEGTGLVKWWFQNTKGIDVPIYSYPFYVPKAPA